MHKGIISGYTHTYQCPPKSYTAGLRRVSKATITSQLVQPQGEIPEEGRKNPTLTTLQCIYIKVDVAS